MVLSVRLHANPYIAVPLAILASVALLVGSSLLHDLWNSRHVTPPQTTYERQGLKLRVGGGVIRRATAKSACVWACAPEPTFTVQRTVGGPPTYSIRVLNIRGREMRLRTDARAVLREMAHSEATLHVAFQDERPHEIHLEYPPEAKRQFTFGVFSDSGGNDGYSIAGRIMRDFAAQPVRFVFSVGDTIGCVGHRLRSRWGVHVFDHYARMARAPVYYVVGDNDLAGWLSDSALPWTSQYGLNNRSFSFGSAHFVVLDSSWLTLSQAALRWLADDLDSAVGMQKFIFMHVPPFDPRSDRQDGLRSPSAEQFMAIVARHPGTHIYSGHLQIRADWQDAGCQLHITGSGGEHIRDKAPSVRHYSHMRVRYDGRQVENIRVNDGLPGLLASTWWRLRLVYPLWLAAHKWEAIGSLLVLALLILRIRRGRAVIEREASGHAAQEPGVEAEQAVVWTQANVPK